MALVCAGYFQDPFADLAYGVSSTELIALHTSTPGVPRA